MSINNPLFFSNTFSFEKFKFSMQISQIKYIKRHLKEILKKFLCSSDSICISFGRVSIFIPLFQKVISYYFFVEFKIYL